jgi:hypothetical protein
MTMDEDAFSILKTPSFGGVISVTPEDWTAIGVLGLQGKLYITKEGALEYINSRGKKATDDNG